STSDRPAIAWNGRELLVSQSVPGPPRVQVAFDRVSPTLASAGPSLLLSRQIAEQEDTAVAFDGTDWLVVWSDDRNSLWNGTDIYAARIAADGTVLDPDGFFVSAASGDQYSPVVAFDGQDFVVAWIDGRGGASALY